MIRKYNYIFKLIFILLWYNIIGEIGKGTARGSLPGHWQGKAVIPLICRFPR
jgi:hypothetical protein